MICCKNVVDVAPLCVRYIYIYIYFWPIKKIKKEKSLNVKFVSVSGLVEE